MNILQRFKPLLIVIFLTTIITGLLVQTSRAADQTITCDNSGCSGLSDGLFNELSVAPGQSITKSIEIINNHDETMKLAMSVSKNSLTDDDFIKIVDVTVKTDGTINRFSGSLESFLTSYIDLEKLESGQNRLVDINLTMQNVGNEYQGKQAKFSFDVKIDQEVPGDSEAAAVSPSPNPVLLTGLVAGAQTALESVLGVSTPSASIVESEGDVLGKQSSNWWIGLIAAAFGFGLIAFALRRLRLVK